MTTSILKLFSVFHLNLAYSSIDEAQRTQVIDQCYWPLLDLARKDIPIGIELTGRTLEAIWRLDPSWIDAFKGLLQNGKVELIGSGDSQIIGPLVPVAVNRANLRIGNRLYREILETIPNVALVNEQAYSAGLVNLYAEAGFQAIIMEWENPSTLNPSWPKNWKFFPQMAVGAGGCSLPVLWNQSVAFQKFQRYVHGEIELEDYLYYLGCQRRDDSGVFCVYGNDVEVFDFRPGRYRTEEKLSVVSEWDRIFDLYRSISDDAGFQLVLPSASLPLLEHPCGGHLVELGSASQPIPVKKQKKYNISRWAVTGRDDVWLNSICHRLARRIEQGEGGETAWKYLCRLWASDLRTHITLERWAAASRELNQLSLQLGADTSVYILSELDFDSDPRALELPDHMSVEIDSAKQVLRIATSQIRVDLSARRGLTINRLFFSSHDFFPIVGTIPQGYFDSIEFGADFYTGLTTVELPTEHRRITDIQHSLVPLFAIENESLVIESRIETDKGEIVKRVVIPFEGENLNYETHFPHWVRPKGLIRAGHITLLPESVDVPVRYACKNGGDSLEIYELSKSFNHLEPASTLVSCTTGLGATDGVLEIGDTYRSIVISWQPHECAAMPMILHQEATPGFLTRVIFSLGEFDETSRDGGHVMPLRLTLSPGSGVRR